MELVYRKMFLVAGEPRERRGAALLRPISPMVKQRAAVGVKRQEY
jgi:hypothetical protein